MIDPNELPEGSSPRTRVNGRRAGEAQDERVRKLEAALTELEAKVSGDAIAERVVARLTAAAPTADGVLIDEAGAVPRTTALALVGPSHGPMMTPPPPPDGAVLHPRSLPPPAPREWFPAQLWSELRLTVRMYFDPRYRISRTAQFLLPAILGLFVFNYFLFSVWFSIPVVSPVLERAACVLLAILFYKVVARELGRYRDVLEYLTRYTGNAGNVK